MRPRHRIPSIFSLSMMDVFCCTLGCVILLWLANQREVMLRAKSNNQLGDTLARERADAARLRDEAQRMRDALAASERAAADAAGQLRAATADRDAMRDRAAKLAADVAASDQRGQVDRDRLSKELTAAQGAMAAADKAARERADALAAATAKADKLQAELDRLTREAADARTRTEQMAGVQRRTDAARDERLAAAERDAAAARDEKQRLAAQLLKATLAGEARFEGIALTGKRVVFLVDMSGSMELVDERTEDKAKWPTVQATLLKIMRSLPELEKYQILMFSDNVIYPMGGAGGWLDYDAAKTPPVVEPTLAAIKPRGNTNMYAALEAAFRLRPSGLDTVYLLSDGLPNAGAGLSENARALTETQRGEQLGRHIRTKLKANWNNPDLNGPRVRINTVGFFYESPDVGAFLWALARENDGSFVGMSRP